MWNTSDFAATATSAAPIPAYQPLADQVKHLLGVYGHRLVFLHHDGWICSIANSSHDVECSFDRHFFLPTDWFSSTTSFIRDRMMLEILRNGTVVFVRRDELAIIRGGMEHTFIREGRNQA